ncbi:MAG: hypothetical protein AAGH76_04215 [Pseudomonadota bacterium]
MSRTFTALLCALVISAATGPTVADAADRVAAPAVSLAQSGGRTLEQAIESVRRQYGGRIISANTVVQGNREVHVIRILTAEGNVKTVRIPGRNRGRGHA